MVTTTKLKRFLKVQKEKIDLLFRLYESFCIVSQRLFYLLTEEG